MFTSVKSGNLTCLKYVFLVFMISNIWIGVDTSSRRRFPAPSIRPKPPGVRSQQSLTERRKCFKMVKKLRRRPIIYNVHQHYLTVSSDCRPSPMWYKRWPPFSQKALYTQKTRYSEGPLVRRPVSQKAR